MGLKNAKIPHFLNEHKALYSKKLHLQEAVLAVIQSLATSFPILRVAREIDSHQHY